MVFANVGLILPDRVISRGWVRVENGLIADLEEAQSKLAVQKSKDAKKMGLSEDSEEGFSEAAMEDESEIAKANKAAASTKKQATKKTSEKVTGTKKAGIQKK